MYESSVRFDGIFAAQTSVWLLVTWKTTAYSINVVIMDIHLLPAMCHAL